MRASAQISFFLFAIICFCLTLSHHAPAQLTAFEIRQVDSLKHLSTTAQHDSTRVKALREWDNLIYILDFELDFVLNSRIDSLCTINLKKRLPIKAKRFFQKGKCFALNNMAIYYKEKGDYDKAIELCNMNLDIQKEIGDPRDISSAYGNLGNIYRNKGDYNKALDYFKRCHTMLIKLGDKKGIAGSFHNIGTILYFQGNFKKAIQNFDLGLKIREEIGDTVGMAMSFINIGSIYMEQGEFDLALPYYKKSLNVYKKINDKNGISTVYNNLGSVYQEKGDYGKAINYFNKSLTLCEEIGDKEGIGNALTNLAGNYHLQKDYRKALEYGLRALEIRKKVGNPQSYSSSLNSVGIIYKEMGDLQKALYYCNKSLQEANKVGAAFEIRDVAHSLWEINKKLGQHAQALSMYELYITQRDSINSEENNKEMIRHEYKYHYEKQAAADSVANAKQQEIKNIEIARQKAEIKAKRNQQYLLFGGLALLLLFAFFMVNRFRVTARQKKEIEIQKLLVEEKQKEIIDSIHYARRIQAALLPSPSYILKKLKSLNREN